MRLVAKQYKTLDEAAKHYKVTRAAVAHQTKKPKGKLADALVMVAGKKRIDMGHAAAKAWVPTRRVARAPPDSSEDIESASGGGLEMESEVRRYWDYTLRQIIERYGTMPIFASMLQAADKVESINARRLDSDRKTGELISRDFVKKHILGLVEQVFQRMLADLPVTLASEVHTMCATDATLEEVQQAIHDAVSRELRTIKKDTTKEIRRARD